MRQQLDASEVWQLTRQGGDAIEVFALGVMAGYDWATQQDVRPRVVELLEPAHNGLWFATGEPGALVWIGFLVIEKPEVGLGTAGVWFAGLITGHFGIVRPPLRG